MKRTISLAALAALAALVLAGQPNTADAATATVATDVMSAYVWRGLTFNDKAVLQPSLDVSHNGFALNVWGNLDLSDSYSDSLNSGDFSEIDLTASYAFKLGAVDVSLGVIEYTFPNGAESTAEVFAGLGYELGAGFTISTKVYYDFDEVDDFYVTAGLGYSYSINDKTTLGLSGLISYAGEDFSSFYASGTDSGFFNYQLTASIKYMVTDAFGIGANINYTDSMDSDVLPEETVDTTVYGGISLSYTF